MTTAVYTHDDCDGHCNPPGHPEQVARRVAVLRGLADLPLDRQMAPCGNEADILRCHPPRHVERLRRAIPQQGWARVDGDTYLAPGSWDAALRGVGGAVAAVDAVLAGQAANAFVATRPPGHHAEREVAMGFCMFGNVAIAAMRALKVHGLARVAVLDFDVHHGNGTQDLLWEEPRAMFVSSHQMPLYPGSGAAREVGAHGQVVNLPLPEGSGGPAMRAAWTGALARVASFRPQLILISAGFDAHADDPLGGLNWTVEDFVWLTRAICDLADAHAGGRVVSVLEGGYDLVALEASAAAHVGVLEERGR